MPVELWEFLLVWVVEFGTRSTGLWLGLQSPPDRKIIGGICAEIGVSDDRIIPHDVEIGLFVGVDKRCGFIIVSVTASIVSGRNVEGRGHRAGGWGHLVGWRRAVWV